MKIVSILLSFFFLFSFKVNAQEMPDPNFPTFPTEHIERFHVDIIVNKDGTINVKESILYDFSNLERHGIFRNIPFTKRNEENKRVDLKFENFTVTNDKGQDYKFEKSTENEQIILKIGDPNKTITGVHTYNISYTVSGAIGYFDDYDELYWNVTGNSWDVPIRYLDAKLTLPSDVQSENIEHLCFTGSYGSQNSNCEISVENNTITIESTNFLSTFEGLTIVVGFPKNIVAYLPAELYVSFWEKPIGKLTIFGIVIAALFWYLILPVVLIVRYFRHGRDPYVGPNVTAWYDPPVTQDGRKLSPTETGGLLDESIDVRDIFAAVVDLARRGYLKIREEEKKKFSLVYVNKPKKYDTLLPFEKKLLDGIFSESKEVKLKDVKFYKTVQDVQNLVYENLEKEEFFPHNPKSVRTKYYVLGTFALISFNLILAFIAFFIGRIMPRKTLFGAQQANVARGIKNFINSQERQLNYQGNKQLFFEKLLPFAVAFGVEKNWAERFKDFNLKNPDWYQSPTSSHFATAAFVSSLNNSYSNFSSSSTPPSSSSSSGFSGGGFSGGGGGGGGGGSW